jgi:hypothetical protein
MFVPGSGPRYSEQEARAAVAASSSFAEALRRLGMRPDGGNHRTLRKYVEQVWGNDALRKDAIPLSRILVRASTYSRSHLKVRLFKQGLKARECELCGQGEIWRGLRMALILDHINGIANDHRLENLRIVCPNCAATLDTLRSTESPRARATQVPALWRGVLARLCGATILLALLRRPSQAR